MNDAFLRFRHAAEEDFRTHHDITHYARRLGYSPRTLSRVVHAATGRSAKDYISERLLLEAKRLLAHDQPEPGPVRAAARVLRRRELLGLLPARDRPAPGSVATSERRPPSSVTGCPDGILARAAVSPATGQRMPLPFGMEIKVSSPNWGVAPSVPQHSFSRASISGTPSSDRTAMATGAFQQPDAETSKGLRSGALGMATSLILSTASAAPAYSLAATLVFIVGFVGFQAPAIVILAFVPILLVSFGYAALNRADPDCGTIFVWASRSFGPRTGFLGGCAIIAGRHAGHVGLDAPPGATRRSATDLWLRVVLPRSAG